MAPPTWRTSTVTLADGRRMGVAEFGPPDGFPILWFHGTPGARRQVPAAAAEYAHDRGVRIIGVERPGVGKSTRHHYGRIIDFAADAEQVMDLLGIERAGLIGLSGGGPYVLAVCSAIPERIVAAAVLGGVGPSAGPEKVSGGGVIPLLRKFKPLLGVVREPVAWTMSAALKVAAPVANPVFDIYMRLGPRSDREFLARPEMREMFLDDLLAAGKESFRAVAYDAVLFSRWWGFDIAGIETPVFLWHGDTDLVIPLVHGERMAALIPNSRLSVVSGEGHLAMLDAAEEAIDLILEQVEDGETGGLRRLATDGLSPSSHHPDDRA
ncbi:MAG: alpha/beta hydrolase [Actinobacteria bacterium]|nr:alpha/beta hydrolase [Actinomycetota bacterium]MCB9413047.1 alpha/beta hydrolase [Actinomycetota bacterium]